MNVITSALAVTRCKPCAATGWQGSYVCRDCAGTGYVSREYARLETGGSE